jgi:ribose transport system substrate-binding protein
MRRPGFGNRRWATGGMAAAAATLVVIAAVGGASAAAGKTPVQASHAVAPATMVIGYSCPRCSVQGLQAPAYGMRAAIKLLKLPWQLKIIDANLSSDKQVSDIDTFVSLKVAALTTWTLDPGATDPAYKRARAAGIPIVGFNSPSKYINTDVLTQTDSTCDVSRQQAQYIASLIPHAKVISIGGPPVPSIRFFTKCWLSAVKAAGLTLLEHKDFTTVDEESGRRNVEAMLLRHPDAQALWSWSDEVALGGVAALETAGKPVWSGSTKGMIVISRDALPEMITAIKEGKSTASWDGNFPEAGAAAIQLLKAYLINKKPLPKDSVVIPAMRWERSNASKFVAPLKRKVTLPLAR